MTFSWGGNPGSARYRLRDAVEEWPNAVQLSEHSLPRWRLPPHRGRRSSSAMRTDAPSCRRHRSRSRSDSRRRPIDSPLRWLEPARGEMLSHYSRIVTILHARQESGAPASVTCPIRGVVGAVRQSEHGESDAAPDRGSASRNRSKPSPADMSAIVLPPTRQVSAVAVVPGGCLSIPRTRRGTTTHARQAALYLAWDDIARDRRAFLISGWNGTRARSAGSRRVSARLKVSPSGDRRRTLLSPSRFGRRVLARPRMLQYHGCVFGDGIPPRTAARLLMPYPVVQTAQRWAFVRCHATAQRAAAFKIRAKGNSNSGVAPQFVRSRHRRRAPAAWMHS